MEVEFKLGTSELGREVLRNFRPLSERQREVLRLRYGVGGQPAMGPTEIAKKLGLSRSSVRSYEARALDRIRHPREL